MFLLPFNSGFHLFPTLLFVWSTWQCYRRELFKRSLLWHPIKLQHRTNAFLRVTFMFLGILYLTINHGIGMHRSRIHKSPVDKDQLRLSWFISCIGRPRKQLQTLVLTTKNHKQPAGSNNAIAARLRQSVIFGPMLYIGADWVILNERCGATTWRFSPVQVMHGNMDWFHLPGLYRKEVVNCIYGMLFRAQAWWNCFVHSFLSKC